MGKHGKLWPGFNTPDGIQLVDDLELYKLIDRLEPGSKLFARARDTDPRRIEVASSRLTYVPKSLYHSPTRIIEPEALVDVIKPRFGGIKPTPAGNARLLIQDIITSEYTPSLHVEHAWLLYLDYFKGPLMIGTGRKLRGVQLDITGAYLWALSQPLPYGPMLEMIRDIERIPADHAGMGSILIEDYTGLLNADHSTPGTFWYRGSLHLIREALRLDLIAVKSMFYGWTSPTIYRDMSPITEIDNIAIRKTLYQMGWAVHAVGYSYGRILANARDLSIVEIPDNIHSHVAWSFVPPHWIAWTRPDIAAHTVALVTARVLEALAMCRRMNQPYGNVISDSVFVPECIAEALGTGEGIGSWRVAKGPALWDCGKEPIRYKVVKE